MLGRVKVISGICTTRVQGVGAFTTEQAPGELAEVEKKQSKSVLRGDPAPALRQAPWDVAMRVAGG